MKKPSGSVSAYSSPTRSPNMSPATHRKGQYHLSMMNRKKTVQFSEKFGQNYASDPNIHRSVHYQEIRVPVPNSTKIVQNPRAGNTGKSGKCSCHPTQEIPEIKIENAEATSCCQNLQHKLVARLRQACSLADLHHTVSTCPCPVSRSLNNVSLGDQW